MIKIKPETKELLEQMAKTQYGRALMEFLDENYSEIGNIMETKSWEETLGRQFALNVLKDLFYFMEEKKKGPEQKPNQYT